MKPCFLKFSSSLACALWAASMPLSAQSSPYRGLWVGEVVLGAVNEVTVPLDENNVPRAPDPNVVTPTFDAASLRLILHVDAAGRTSLLKHVAILARKADVQEKESDMALVTDERLYGAFPPQPATRISSAVFDFGDAKATAAVNQVVERAAAAAATAAAQPGATVATIKAAAQAAAAPVVVEADATEAFNDFLQAHLDKTKVIAIADGGSTAAARAEAIALRDGSFFHDVRGVEMLDALEATLAGLPAETSAEERRQIALNTVAAFAETDLAYDRFLAGELFGDMISVAAGTAAASSESVALKPVTGFQESESGAAVAVVSAAHGLNTGDEVAIQGAPIAGYNGLHPIVRLDDDSFRITTPYISGGTIDGYAASDAIAPLIVTSPAHGLESGARIVVRDSISTYNGNHLVTVIDADTFSIDIPFASDPAERGVWSARSGEIAGFEGTEDGSAGVKVTAPNHGLDNGQVIEIRGSGSDSYNGIKTITRIDADTFSLNQAFAGDPAVKGAWDVPVEILGFEPPADAPTLVTSSGHGLSSGDRVLVSGSGNAAYNAEFRVTVVDADSFSIPVAFDEATGNPATKGSWQPAAGGQWRPTAPIRAALDQQAKVAQARTTALNTKLTAYDDSRAPDAVELVLDAIVEAAATSPSSLTVEVSTLADQAGRDALSLSVLRYARPSTVPSTDYTGFVRSADFAASVATAAEAAATGAFEENKNLIATPTSIRDKALAAAIDALAPVFAAASRSLLTELPMSGEFGVGGSGLAAEIVLPANHPTNPFRHRRHPDHTVGFDIRRLVNLSFQPQDGQALTRAGYGVDRITGTYDEEIFGLHKPLGPSRDTGLKVRGTFQLNRISLIDTLNGR
ncbi:hypothetical protein [Luteolibacter marinus]|uniref:hypothetical protein n=1 Tax=Luteolibacter marinus TaxID=2776705 RepID=UPI0018688186|nr:hypothetical protein [Luteolibacter marinus]